MEFQESRMYLWFCDRMMSTDMRIVVGEIDGNVLIGDDGQLYERELLVGPLNRTEFYIAIDLIRVRGELVAAGEQTRLNLDILTGKLFRLWRSVK